MKKITKNEFILLNNLYTDRELRKILGITDINYYRKKFGLKIPKRKKVLFDDEIQGVAAEDIKNILGGNYEENNQK